ncbi:hypothetical protein A4G20_07215 [Pasteurellaceae bacterium RH1A]|nr:hypothetical protein A4G20_07215 [Pasteurellaceae bacterium RH1A]
MAQRILMAAEVLMAREGVQNLSTHKIAKEAKLSVGTIYVHFKDKDDLLTQLVLFLFQRFYQDSMRHAAPGLPLFEQYRKMWLGKWHYLQNNPTIVMNMHQYEALPKFHDVVKFCTSAEDMPWNQFLDRGRQTGEIANLPNNMIYALSFGVIRDLAYIQIIEGIRYSEAMIEEMVERTWLAIRR